MEKLKLALELAINQSKNSIEHLPWNNRSFYGNYLAQTFYYVRHSTRMLATSAGRLSYENQQNLHLRFLKHLGEEAGHEKLAINDLKALGFKPEDYKELDETRFFYESQYYKIEHVDPLAIMGYILYLEVMAQHICPPLTKKITELYGQKAATFLLVHGEEDPHHVEEAHKLLAMLPSASIDIITENLLQSSNAFNLMLNEMATMAKVEKWKKSA
jgi:pyrroloquinoline quinone (PQQ) biosynthesis protein C